MNKLFFLIKLLSGFIIIAFALILIGFLGQFIFSKVYKFPQSVKYGVTFSPRFALQLKMDWKDTYIKILDDLKVKYIRIPSYWDDLSPQSDKNDFSSTDFMLEEAGSRGVKVTLTLGERQFRWPECYIPSWAKNLDINERHQKLLEFVQSVVERYRSSEAVTAWEVENEPLLQSFGSGCDKPDKNFLKTEAELVKSLDKRPVILTDSGELGSWATPMRLSDIFGTTVYRTVYNKTFGFLKYPTLPYFYNLKSNIVRSLFAPNNSKTIIIELQAEPWSPNNGLVNTNIDKQVELFGVDSLKNNVNFARSTGFDEVYLWGVEWWYFMAQKGHPEYLDYAKSLF